MRSSGCEIDQVRQGGTAEFHGRGLNLLEGDTVVAEMKGSDGQPVTAECPIVSSSVDCLVVTIPSAFNGEWYVGKKIAFTVTSHCGQEESIPGTAKHTATLLAGTVPPGPEPTVDAPTVTGGHSQGFEADEGKMHFGSAFILEGTNLGGAAVRLQYTAASGTVHDDPVAAQDVTVNEDGTSLTIALDATNPAVSSTQEGDDITIVVTTAGGTAEFDAESAGDA